MLKLIIVSLLLPIVAWGNAELFNLKSDKASYVPNEKAILVINVVTLPQNPNFEVVIKNEVNAHEVLTVKLSDHQYISKIEDVGTGPLVHFKSKYFLRDKSLFAELETALLTTELKITELIKSRRGATPEEQTQIDEAIESLEDRMDYLETKQAGLLRLVEEKTLEVPVAAPTLKMDDAFLFLSSDRDNATFVVGENLTVFGHVYLRIEDKDALLKASVGETPLSVEKLQNDEFLIESEAFETGDIGNHEVTVQLFLRDKYRSTQLDAALAATNSEIVRLNAEIILESDPVRLLELQKQLEKVISIKAHITSILGSLEQLIETAKYKFVVEAP